MSKQRVTIATPQDYIEPCKLYNQEKGWWQCGVWVSNERNATIYPNREEAEQVKRYRILPLDTEVVVLDR
jgi:hypothetical protein